MPRQSIKTLLQKKQEQEKIVMSTAYSARIAEIIDSYVDIILVGDSLGMTLHGLDSTVGVTMEMMILAGQAVHRGRSKAMMIVDLPFSSYESSPERAYKAASKIMQKTNAEAIKLEGGEIMAETISFLTKRNIPVMGHVGLLPQSVHHYGGYGVRGKNTLEAEQLQTDIQAVKKAGAFGVVIEGVTENIARQMHTQVDSPDFITIGIGASTVCDGQVLVSDDLIGLSKQVAKFVKSYTNIQETIKKAMNHFSTDVKEKKFPTNDYTY